MRTPPYPAEEDALLERTFGRAYVEGRTVICAVSHASAQGEWHAVVLRDPEGALFFLERDTRGGGPAALRAAPLDQALWSGVAERLIPLKGHVDALESWMSLLPELRGNERWDQDADDAIFDQLEALLAVREAESEALNRALKAASEADIERAIQNGSEASGDAHLVRAFGPEPLRGKTLVWNLVDLHAGRPWRGCVLMEDDGTPYVAEISTDVSGRPTASLDHLDQQTWRRMAALAYWRMSAHGNDSYTEAAGAVSLVNLAIDPARTRDPKEPWGGVSDYVEKILDGMSEAAERRDAGLRPS